MSNPTHSQMCKKIVQLTKVVHRLNVLNQTHQIELEKRDTLHAEEISCNSRDFHHKFDSITSDLKKKDDLIKEIMQAKERIKVQRAKEKNEYMDKLDNAMVSKREVELNLNSKIKKNSFVFQQKSNEMHCLYEDRESALKSQIMVIQRTLERDADGNKQLIQNLIKRQNEELDRISSEASRDRQSAKLALKEQYDLKLRSEQISFESLLADKEVLRQQLKDSIQRLHEDMKEKEYLSQSVLKQRNQELSNAKRFHTSQVEELKQNLLGREIDADMGKKKLAEATDEVERGTMIIYKLKKSLLEREIDVKKDRGELTVAKEKVEQQNIMGLKLKVEADALVHRISTLTTELRSVEIKFSHVLMESHKDLMAQSQILVELWNCVDDAKSENVSLKLSMKGWKSIVVDLRTLNNALKKDLVTKIREASRESCILKEDASQQIVESIKVAQRQLLEVQTEHGLQINELKERHNKEKRNAVDEANQTLQNAKYQNQADTKQLMIKITMLERKLKDAKEKGHSEISLLKNQINDTVNEAALKRKAEDDQQHERNTEWRKAIEKERTEHEKRELDLESSQCKELEECKRTLIVTHQTHISLLTSQFEESCEALSRDHHDSSQKVEQRFKEFERSSNVSMELLQSEIANERKSYLKCAEEFDLSKEALTLRVVYMDAEITRMRTVNNDVVAQVKQLNVRISIEESAKEQAVVQCNELNLELKLAEDRSGQIINRQSVDMKDMKSRHDTELTHLEKSLHHQCQVEEEIWNTQRLDLFSRLLNGETYATNLESKNNQMTKDIQCLQHELGETRFNQAKMKKDIEVTLLEMYRKEDLSKQSVQKCHDIDIASLTMQLQIIKTELDRCQEALQWRRHPADVEKIKDLAEQLVAYEESVKKAKDKMGYYKNELKNREENFNSRFTHTNHQTVGVMSTLKRRPGTSDKVRSGESGSRRSIRANTKIQSEFPKIV